MVEAIYGNGLEKKSQNKIINIVDTTRVSNIIGVPLRNHT